MRDSGYRLNAEQLGRRAAGYGYDPEQKTWIRHGTVDQMRFLPYDDPDRHAECGGGLFSTPADMAKLAQLIANRGVFNGQPIISSGRRTRRSIPWSRREAGIPIPQAIPTAR